MRKAKSVVVGEAIARGLIRTFQDPAMRGPNWKWENLPEFVAGHTRATLFTAFRRDPTEHEHKLAEDAARAAAVEFLNEKKIDGD